MEDQGNDQLRYKQNQYAQRSSERVQARRSDEQKTAEYSVCIREINK